MKELNFLEKIFCASVGDLAQNFGIGFHRFRELLEIMANSAYDVDDETIFGDEDDE